MILKPLKIKIILLLLISIAFTVIGFVFRIEIPMFLGYVATVFFGLGSALFLVQLLPGANQLEIASEGLKYRVLFKETTILWKNVGSFYEVIMQDGKTKKVGWHYSPEVIGQIEAKQGRPVDTTIPHGILPENYGKSAQALAELLNKYKAQNA